MKKFVLDCKCIKSKSAFHKACKRVFKLDDYYGENLDALWDMLTERKYLDIKVKNSKNLLINLGDYGQMCLELLMRLNDVNENYRVRIY